MSNLLVKVASILLPITFVVFLLPVHTLAFSDYFTSDPKITTSNWEVSNPHGLVWLNPGIEMSSTTSSSFPYMRAKSSMISSADKYYEIKFQYVSTGSPWGVGGSFTDNAPVFPTYLNTVSDYLTYNIAYFFGEKLHFVTSLCPKYESICPYSWWFIYPNSTPSNSYYSETKVDTLPHTFSVLRSEVGTNLYSYQVFIDSRQIFESQNTSRLINNVWIGHPSDLGEPKNWPTLKIFSVRSLPDLPSTFPYLSQKDTRWGNEEYDSAKQWAGLEKSGIDRWGCALTSVAMVLQNYNVKTIAGDPVNPDNLNAWLKSQPDGYIGPGLLNWLAITRYAKASFEAGKAPKKLEYIRSYLPTPPTLPAILSTGSHFVVAHSENMTSWTINDPANTSQTTLAKTTAIKSVNRFVESNTDLSYMMFVTDATISATLQKDNGDLVSIDWQDEYLSDDVDGTQHAGTHVGLMQKPESGKYKLEIIKTGDQTIPLTIYLYDNAGVTEPKSYPLTQTNNIFEINYLKTENSTQSIIEKDLTPPLSPILLFPVNGSHVKTVGLVLDWSDVTDSSDSITYNYKSAWEGGSYGPVSTGNNSYIDASGSPDQTYSWQVQACDRVGNCSLWTSPSTLTVDSVAPSVDLVFPVPGTSSTYFEAVFSEPVDPVEATDSAKYFLSNWPGAGGSGNLMGDANITYTIASNTARVNFTNPDWYISSEQLWGVQDMHDLAGNILTPTPYTEYSTTPIAPVVTAATISPNPTSLLTQTWSWLAGVDSGSGVKGYSTKIYDSVAQQYLSDWLWIGQVLGTNTTLGEGLWKMALQASDQAGNISEPVVSDTLIIDLTTPSVATNLHFTNPDVSCGGFTNSKNITFDWDDATDNNQVAGYEYMIDYPLNTTRGSWTTFFTTSHYRGSLNVGIHYLKLRTQDRAGNYSAWSNSCSITYDPYIPILYAKTIFTNEWQHEPVTSYFDFSDENLMNDYLAPSCEIQTEGSTSRCGVTPQVCDKAGNCFTTPLISNSAQIDLTKPSVEISAWGSTINGTSSDNLSGVSKVELRITKPDKSEITVVATGTNKWSYTLSDAPYGDYSVKVIAYDHGGNTSEEAGKDFVMSPPASSLQVLGATTSKAIVSVIKDEPVSPILPPVVTPTPSPEGEVLGKNVRYLWSLGLLPIAGVLWFIFQAKKKS